MELQSRDQLIIEFLSEYKIATIKAINSIFFSSNTSSEACRRRLQKLTQVGYVQMYKDGFGREHLFRIDGREAREVEDKRLAIVRFVAMLVDNGFTLSCDEISPKVGGITYDWGATIERNGISTYVFVIANIMKPYPSKKIAQSLSQHNLEYKAFTAERCPVARSTFVSLSNMPAMNLEGFSPTTIDTNFKNTHRFFKKFKGPTK